MTIATEAQTEAARAVGAELVARVDAWVRPMMPPEPGPNLRDFNIGYALVDCALLSFDNHPAMLDGIAAAIGAYAAQAVLRGGDPDLIWNVVNGGLRKGWAQVVDEMSPRGRA